MERSTVSPEYQATLTNLAESLMADRRQRFADLLAQTDPFPFIPKPTESPESVIALGV